MKTTIRGITLTTACLLFASVIHTKAIEGLQISLQCSNVVLSWPSLENETYIVQYRPTLDVSTPWQTLTSSLPADLGTNLTFYVHSNIVAFPNNCGGSFALMAGNGGSNEAQNKSSFFEWGVPLAMTADGGGSIVPLGIYPHGLDLSHLFIYDARIGEDWMPYKEYSVFQAAMNAMESEIPEPQEGESGDGGEDGDVGVSDMGFYQVVRTGVSVAGLTNLTNSAVSGTITIPFEAGNAFGSLRDATVLVDGVRYKGVTPQRAPFIGGLTVDTTFLENGEHYMQVQVSWVDFDTFDQNSAFIHHTSQPFTLTVSNSIYFPDWVSEIGELGETLYSAKTIYTNADWTINIYDASSNFVQSLTGHTDDGLIEAYWNLTDTNGVVRTNLSSDPEFFANVIVLAQAAQVTNRVPVKQTMFPFPVHGQWAIAYQDVFRQMVNSNRMFQAIYDMGSLGQSFGGAYTVMPSNPTNGQTFPLRYPSTNHSVTAITMYKDMQALEGLLTNTNRRNFFYAGHATAEGFAAFLSASDLSIYLKRHYYRFVFFTACSSANGGIPAAFGIDFNMPLPYSYFQRQKIRPRAFLGYNRDVHYCNIGIYIDPSTGQTAYGSIPNAVPDFLTNFQFYWYFNYDLLTAVTSAIQSTPYIGPGWATGEDLQIYGYDGLRVDDFNWDYQWSN